MASSASSPQRDLPALAGHVGRRRRAARPRRARRATSTPYFWRLPEEASAERRAAPARAGRARLRPVRRVPPARRGPRAPGGIRRTGACRWGRLRDDRSGAARAARRAAGVVPRVLSDCRGPRTGPLVNAGLVAGDIVIDAKSGVSGAGKAPSERTHFSEWTGACRPTACSRTGTPPKSSRSSGRSVTFVPHLVPLDRGILETIYTRVSRRARRKRDCRGVSGGLRECAVRPADAARRCR